MMFSIRPSSLSLRGFEHPSEGCFNGPHGSHEKDMNPAISIAFLRRVLIHMLEVTERGLVSQTAPSQ